MKLSRSEISLLVVSLEGAIQRSKNYLSKIDSGEIADHDPDVTALSRQYLADRIALLHRLNMENPND